MSVESSLASPAEVVSKGRSGSRPLRDSGVTWLGSVPADWEQQRLKFAVGLINEKADAGSIDMPYVGMENVESATGRYLPGVTEQAADGLSSRFQAGDVLFGKLRPYLAKALHAGFGGVCSSELLVMRPRAVDSRYLLYYVLSAEFVRIVDSSTYGAKMPRASWQFIGNLPILLPPLAEQRAIAEFLDRETAKIDELIAKKQRLDELLIEKIRSVQSLTVTGCAQPQSHAIATDIPWLPSCPDDWQRLPLRRVVKWIEQGWSPACDGREAEADEWGVLKAGCVNSGELDESENKKLPDDIAPELSYQIRPGNVLMSRACGTPSLVGSVAFVRQCREKLLLCDKVFRLHPMPSRIMPEFLAEVLKSKASRVQIEQSLSGADGLANNITQTTIKDIVIAVPPLAEQKRICSVVAEIRRQIHELRIKTQSAITGLKEYRSALISAAVTGQIDVRHYREDAQCPAAAMP